MTFKILQVALSSVILLCATALCVIQIAQGNLTNIVAAVFYSVFIGLSALLLRISIKELTTK